MPIVFHILVAALAAAILLGLLRPIRCSKWTAAGLIITAVVIFVGIVADIDRYNFLPLATYGGIVWGITACAASLARLLRSRGLPLRARLHIHIGSLVMLAGYAIWVGPIGKSLVADYVSKNTGLVDDDGTVRQTTPVTCGPASLATALGRLGIVTSERDLALRCGTSLMGTSWWTLEDAANEYGCVLTPAKHPLTAAKSSDFPALVSVNLRGLGVPHFVAMTSRTETAVYMADPSNGGRWIDIDEAEGARWGQWYTVIKLEVSNEQMDRKEPVVRPVGHGIFSRTLLALTRCGGPHRSVWT